MMDHIVELELIDLPGVELGEARPHVLEQCPQLRLVIGSDKFPCGTTISVPGGAMLGVPGLGHEP
jgi:hypothetical protein